MTLRFQQGEIAIFAVSMTPEGAHHVGHEVEITAVGPFHQGQVIRGKTKTAATGTSCDYLMQMSLDGTECMALDWQLRKINPPEEPVSLRRTSDIEEEITA